METEKDSDERAKEFLACLGNGKTIYQIESEENENVRPRI